MRLIELSRSRFLRSLGVASKLNRDPRFIQDLMEHGEDRASEFLAALAFEATWRSRDPDAVMGFFAEDAEIVSAAPFPEGGHYKGKARILPFVAKHLAVNVRVDLTKKQAARNRVAWTVRRRRDGKIKALRLGAGT